VIGVAIVGWGVILVVVEHIMEAESSRVRGTAWRGLMDGRGTGDLLWDLEGIYTLTLPV
jgi:hypothetical protein